jgi:hypothetical protein
MACSSQLVEVLPPPAPKKVIYKPSLFAFTEDFVKKISLKLAFPKWKGYDRNEKLGAKNFKLGLDSESDIPNIAQMLQRFETDFANMYEFLSTNNDPETGEETILNPSEVYSKYEFSILVQENLMDTQFLKILSKCLIEQLGLKRHQKQNISEQDDIELSLLNGYHTPSEKLESGEFEFVIKDYYDCIVNIRF